MPVARLTSAHRSDAGHPRRSAARERGQMFQGETHRPGTACQVPEDTEAAERGGEGRCQSPDKSSEPDTTVPAARDFAETPFQLAQALLGAGDIAVNDIRLRRLFVQREGHCRSCARSGGPVETAAVEQESVQKE